jgi:hypothetical protein
LFFDDEIGIMGIFAERSWYTFEMINRDTNSLSAYFSEESSWVLVITRENSCLKNVPIQTKINTSPNTWTYETPKLRFWNKNRKDFAYYAIYLVPWNTYDDGDGTDGMIPMINNKLGTIKRRIVSIGNNYMKIHKFLSDFQYPFLLDIRRIDNIYLYFHKRKQIQLEKEIIQVALRPERLHHYLSLGYSINDWCNY